MGLDVISIDRDSTAEICLTRFQYRDPKTGRFAKKPLDYLPDLGVECGRNFAAAGVHGYGETEEYYVRETELWHRITFRFDDQYDVDAIKPLYENYIDPVLSKHYSSFAILKAIVAITNDEGDIIADGVRSVSAIFEYSDLLDSIEFNVKNWLRKGEYQVLLGLIIEVRKS